MTAPNLLTNPSAEANASNWVPTGGDSTISRDNAVPAFHGDYYFTATVIEPLIGTVNQDSDMVSVSESQPYSFAIRHRWINGVAKEVRLDARWLDGNLVSQGTNVGTTSNGGRQTSSTSWQTITRLNLVSPPATVLSSLRFAVLLAELDDVVAFDGAQLEAGTTLSSEIIPVTGDTIFRFNGTTWVPQEMILL